MSKLILHIGAHKTGTTSLQYCFDNNHKLLKSHSIYYPRLHKHKAHHDFTAPWISHITSTSQYAKQDALNAWKALSDEFANTEQTVFLSSEVFSRIKPESVNFRELSLLVEKFDEVEILYVMRDQATMLQSIFMEVTRYTAQPINWETMIERVKNNRPPTGVSLDHNVVLNKILEGFDDRQIHFATYSNLQKSSADFFGFFLTRCGINGIPDKFSFQEVYSNVSFDPLSHWLSLRLFPWNKEIDPDLAKVIRKTLDECFDANEITTLMTRSEINLIQEKFQALNLELMPRLLNKSKYLELPKIIVPQGAIMRNMLKPEFWLMLEKNIVSHRKKLKRRAPWSRN